MAGPDNRLDPLFTAPNLEEPWFKSMVRGIRDMLNPPKLPPLEVTSKPVENVDMGGMSVVEQSW